MTVQKEAKVKKKFEGTTVRGVKVKKWRLKIVLTTRMLGTLPRNKDVYAKYIATRAPTPEKGEAEQEDIQEVEEKSWTGYLKDEKGLYLQAYQIQGFFKEQLESLRECGAHDLKAPKRKVGQFLFVEPQRIYIRDEAGAILKEIDGLCERPLRAETQQGPRVCLARSDEVAAGRILECDVVTHWPEAFTEELLRAVLDRGPWAGLGQWRTGGNGRFGYELEAK